jgi:hypothetical protein
MTDDLRRGFTTIIFPSKSKLLEHGPRTELDHFQNFSTILAAKIKS